MKKVILSSIFALALLVIAGYGVNKSMNSNAILSDLALANVEALADGESGGSINVNCRYAKSTGDPFLGNFHWRCQSCKYELSYDISNSSSCTYYY